ALESEASDPLVHAMASSLAYLDGDLDTMLSKATETKSVAEALMAEDELRGNLYMAVGIFLEGAHTLLTEGTVSGTPQALAKLQRVFTHMDRAERIAADDPELNLLKGYMDVMLAVNLPFSDPDDAIANLDAYAGPDYVSQRGIAIAYRDLGEVDQALIAVNKALEAAPENPDLIYLRGQIYARQGKVEESFESFSKALEYAEQLPDGTVRQLRYEQCRVDAEQTDCGPRLDAGEFDV
ncbi:MAG: Sll0314/Alr1548 family TPR repeat-containing protein, partial [Cyanobacteria bacterium J06642_9]